MKSMNFRSLTIAVIVAVLCFVSLAGAQGKEKVAKIEPKLVYEKQFDFEIEQGRIGDDGSLFPTIFVTQDNRVLFLNEKGDIHKSLSFTWPNYIAKISDDGENVIIMTPHNREKNEFDVKIYDTSGKERVNKRMSFSYGRPVDIFLTIDAKDVIVFFAGGGLVEPCGIGFYDGSLNLRRLYTRDDFEHPLIPGSIWRNPREPHVWLSRNNQYLLGTGATYPGVWGIYAFDIKGVLCNSIYLDTLSMGSAAIANDGSKIVCVVYESWMKERKKKGIASYILIYIQNEGVKIIPLSNDSQLQQIWSMPLVFSQSNRYFAFVYGNTLFLYDFDAAKLNRYMPGGIMHMQVVDVLDDGIVLIKGEKDYVRVIDKLGDTKLDHLVQECILEARFSFTKKEMTVITAHRVIEYNW